MLNNIKQRKQEGFTIIEVMIVLAIAGLIMVVVFLAVPALQRSSRNNALETDANNVLTAVGDYTSNNGGTLPTAMGSVAAGSPATPSNGTVTIGATSTNQTTAKVGTGTLSVQINGTTITNGSKVGVIEIVTGTKGNCNATGTALSGNDASPRSYAVLYVAESGSGNILKCIGS